MTDKIVAPQEVSEMFAEEIKESKLEQALIEEVKAPLKKEIKTLK